jgi:hypothetical protein
VTGVKAISGITYPFLKVVVQEKPDTWFMGPVPADCHPGLQRRRSSF